MAIRAKSYGGKNGDGETLSEHTIRCLDIARVLLGNLPFDGELMSRLRKDLPLALAIHDTGKAATGFQESLEGKRWGHRHEILSAAFASSLGLSDEIILAIITHHKILPITGLELNIKGALPSEEIPWLNDEPPIWEDLVIEWEHNKVDFEREWNEIKCHLETQDLNIEKPISLKSLEIQRAWLSKSKQIKKIQFEKRYYASILRGLLITVDHIASNNSIQKNIYPIGVPDLKEFNVFTGALYNFQTISSKVSGDMILRSPTGSGKTLAALLWARNNQSKNGRLYYVLPNIASINAMYKRLRSIFFENVGMMHSRTASTIYNWRENDEISKLDNQKQAFTISSLTREMWFPIRVCTPHQILRYSLQGKGWELMLSEFPKSCFIFDEVHAYEPRIIGLLIATVKFLKTLNAKCLFLSATIPHFIQKLIEDETGINHFIQPSQDEESDKKLLNQKRHNIRFIDNSILNEVEHIIEKTKDYESNLIVCNTIKASQLVFETLRESYKDIVLLHSQFNREDRNRIEDNLRNKLPKILVSTQAVEVSLDVDFEQGFTESAPIDAMVQRFGRVNRKGTRPPANIWIFRENISNHWPYNKGLIDKSIKGLETLENPINELDLMEVINEVYKNGFNEKEKEEYDLALNNNKLNNFSGNLIAGIHYPWVDEIIDDLHGSIDLLPYSLYEEFINRENQGLYLEANNLLVSTGIKKMIGNIDLINKNNDPWIINAPYSKLLGLKIEKEQDNSNII